MAVAAGAFAALMLLSAAPLRAQHADEGAAFRLAQIYEQSGKYEDALRYYQDLSRSQPANPAYFDGLRRCLTQLKRYDEAVAILTERLRAHPRDAMLLVRRGSAYFRSGSEAKAREDWDEALRREPGNAGIYSAIAEEAMDNRLYETAVEYLLRGRTALKMPQLFVMEIARAHASGMKFDAAMKEYISLVIAVPSVVWQVQQQIAQFADLPEALQSAVRVAQEAAEEEPSNASVRYLLSWLHMERKDYKAAKKVYAEIDRIRNAGGAELMSFAQRAFSDKAYAPARDALSELIARYPRAQFIPEAEYLHARCVEEAADVEMLPAALDPFTPAREAPGSEAIPVYKGAIELYERIAAKYKGLHYGLESSYRIALIRFKRFRDTDGALSLLRDLAPLRRNVMGKVDAYVLAGDIHLARGDMRKAIEAYEAALKMSGLAPQERQEVEFRRAEIFYFRGDIDSTLSLLEPLTRNSGDDIANDALELNLFILQFRAPSEEALRLFARSAFLERCGKLSEAAELLHELILRHGSAPLADQAYLKRALLQRASGQPEQARVTLNSFLETCADCVLRDQALFALASLLEHELQAPDAALELYQRVLMEHPGSKLSGAARERILELRKGKA